MRSSLLVFVIAFLLTGMTAGLTAGCGDSGSKPDPDAAPDPVPDATPAPDAGPDLLALLADSLVVWQEAKAADDGTYGYTWTTSSFTGYRTITTFVVSNDVVVRRTYEAYDENNQLVESFDEQADQVGSNPGGRPVYTIDQIYEVCRDEVLTQDPEQNALTLRTRPDGILEACLYRSLDCADDCQMGVQIDSLDLNATL
jgi:hypothetical protein